MKFDDVKASSEPRKQYPRVKITATLERVIKKGSTDKGSWIVLGFDKRNSGILFGTKEEIDDKLNGIEPGSEVELELSGSKKGNVIKDIRVASEGEEEPSPSHAHLSDEDLSVFLPVFRCQNCGEDTLMFKDEYKDEIERRVKKGILKLRYPHVQEN